MALVVMDIALSTNAELDITTEFLNLPVYFAPVAPLLNKWRRKLDIIILI
jgi:hypothetical protein